MRTHHPSNHTAPLAIRAGPLQPVNNTPYSATIPRASSVSTNSQMISALAGPSSSISVQPETPSNIPSRLVFNAAHDIIYVRSLVELGGSLRSKILLAVDLETFSLQAMQFLLDIRPRGIIVITPAKDDAKMEVERCFAELAEEKILVPFVLVCTLSEPLNCDLALAGSGIRLKIDG
ncbi:hypothetical protein HYALB_00010033 [Hymenoscyphus albidus]|uniref:Uncharacterized protein n=1 Tax=Hymenoscyphus albidus TaxID=595503 RepID=A0A9N9LL71_9HELO|nr:hypothetical protein HYALB_00010033 [Hymenoscyphus albidus]